MKDDCEASMRTFLDARIESMGAARHANRTRRAVVSRDTARAILSLAIAVVSGAVAQAERLPLRTLTTADGLAHNVVNRVVGDSRGFVWFCTREGLARFDGHRFTTFGLADGLPSAVVTAMIETKAGDYWIGTGDGLVRLDARGGQPVEGGERRRPLFIRYVPGTDHRARAVRSVLERPDGGLWVGTGLGLFRLERADDTWQFQAEPLLGRTPEVSALAEDASGTLWVGTSEGVYARRRGAPAVRWTTNDGLPGNRVLDVFVDGRQRVWVGTTRGLARLRSDAVGTDHVVDRTFTSADSLGTNWVWQVTETRDGTLWAATDNGLVRFVPSPTDGDYTFRRYGVTSGLPSHHVSALAEDRSRHLWIGTRDGASRLLTGGFTIFDAQDGVPTASALSLTRTGDVVVLEAVDEWRLNRYDGRNFIETTIPTSQLTNSWGWNQMFLVDRTGDSWLGSRTGVWRFRGAAGIDTLDGTAPTGHYTTADGLATDVVLRLFEDSRSDIWISTVGEGERRNGLSRWERATGTLHHYSERDGLPPLDQFYVSALAEDRSGGLWVGLSGDGGLARFRDGRFSRFTAADGVPGGSIRNLLLDSDGRLWAASYRAGLIGTDAPAAPTPRFWRYSRDEGLSSNEVGAVVEDLSGHIYVGTARGIDVVDPETRHVRMYPARDGLPPGEAQAAVRDASGALWFTFLKGVVRVLPDSQGPAAAPRILITGIRVAGKALHLSQIGEPVVAATELTHTENAVEVDFVAPGFGPRDALYQVKLEGGRDGWSHPSEQRSVTFANLAPGRYRFVVRAVTPMGMTSQGDASFAFTIAPPFWQRWWFMASCALVLGGTVRAIVAARTVRLRALVALRTRMASDLHDDIGANLTRIAVLTEVVRRDVDPASQADRHLEAIAEVARESVASMGDIVWTVNPERDTLHELARKIRQHAEEVVTDSAAALTIDVPVTDVGIPGDVRRDVYLVAKEAATNAARHAHASAVSLRLAVDANRLVLTVSDNGKGFDPTPATTGHGLENMQRRATRLRATLDVTSVSGSGTTIRLDVPLDRSA